MFLFMSHICRFLALFIHPQITLRFCLCCMQTLCLLSSLWEFYRGHEDLSRDDWGLFMSEYGPRGVPLSITAATLEIFHTWKYCLTAEALLICWCKRAVLILCSVTVCSVEECTQTATPPSAPGWLIPRLELDPLHSAASQEETSPSIMQTAPRRHEKVIYNLKWANFFLLERPFLIWSLGGICSFVWTHCSHTVNRNGMFLRQESSTLLRKLENCTWPLSFHWVSSVISRTAIVSQSLEIFFIYWKSLERGLRMGPKIQSLGFEFVFFFLVWCLYQFATL